MGILTGKFGASNGRATVGGWNVQTHPSDARKCMGVCPQFDALFDHLTVLEHLAFYAAIKGIRPHDRVPELIQDMITRLHLEPFRTTQVQTLSGGNKRKVSTAIALLGSPPVIFLDEPSTGMDPATKRRYTHTHTHMMIIYARCLFIYSYIHVMMNYCLSFRRSNVGRDF